MSEIKQIINDIENLSIQIREYYREMEKRLKSVKEHLNKIIVYFRKK